MRMSQKIFFLSIIAFLCCSVSTMHEVHVLKAHALLGGDGSSIPTTMALSPGANFATVALAGRGIYVWNTSQRSFLKRWQISEKVTAIDIDNEGKLLAAVNDNYKGQILLYRGLMDPDFRYIGTLDFMPIDIKFVGNHRAIIASDDGKISLWDLENQAELQNNNLYHSIRSLVVNIDGSMIGTTTYHTNFSNKKNKVSLIDTRDITKVVQSVTPSPSAVTMSFCPATQKIALLQGNGLTVSDLSFNTISFTSFNIGSLTNLAFSPDGKTIFLTTLQGGFFRIDLEDLSVLEKWHWPWTLSYSKDIIFQNAGHFALTWSQEDRGRLWFLPDTEFFGEDDAGLFRIPQKSNSKSDRDLGCRLSNDNKLLTIFLNNTYRGGQFTILWRTYDADGEVISAGKQIEHLERPLEIILTNNEHASRCDAYYEVNSVAP